MSDDKMNRGEPDRSRINLNEDYEVSYWSERFGITKEQLTKAVEKVGNSPEDIARLVGKSALSATGSPFDAAQRNDRRAHLVGRLVHGMRHAGALLLCGDRRARIG